MTFLITFSLISFALAAAEPFLPFGSMLVSWASVVGVKKTGWLTIFMLIAAGFTRDIVLVKPLGGSSVILLSVWMCSELCASRCNHPFFIAILTSVVGSMVLSFLERQSMGAGVVLSGGIAFIFLSLWERYSEGNGIMLRRG